MNLRFCATPHSFSQLNTSFFALESLGILRALLIAYFVFRLLQLFKELLIISPYVKQYCTQSFIVLTKYGGEYRSRTDDLLRAKQAL